MRVMRCDVIVSDDLMFCQRCSRGRVIQAILKAGTPWRGLGLPECHGCHKQIISDWHQ